MLKVIAFVGGQVVVVEIPRQMIKAQVARRAERKPQAVVANVRIKRKRRVDLHVVKIFADKIIFVISSLNFLHLRLVEESYILPDEPQADLAYFVIVVEQFYQPLDEILRATFNRQNVGGSVNVGRRDFQPLKNIRQPQSLEAEIFSEPNDFDAPIAFKRGVVFKQRRVYVDALSRIISLR